MTAIEFRIPNKTLLITQNQRLHHHAKAKKVAHLREWARTEARNVVVPTPCHLDVLAGWPDRRRRDVINISPTVKALVDGLVDAGVVPDDDSTHIVSETYRSWVAGNRGHTTIRLTLTPVQEDA